jgi:hypothetical protein
MRELSAREIEVTSSMKRAETAALDEFLGSYAANELVEAIDIATAQAAGADMPQSDPPGPDQKA